MSPENLEALLLSLRVAVVATLAIGQGARASVQAQVAGLGANTVTVTGTNTYSGETTVKQGTLSIATANSLGDKTDVYISEGAILELNFEGEMRIGKLYLGGKLQPDGVHNLENTTRFIKGKGSVKAQ